MVQIKDKGLDKAPTSLPGNFFFKVAEAPIPATCYIQKLS